MNLPGISRRINRKLGGGAEMCCSRAYRSGLWWFVLPMDAAAWLLWRERSHCLRCFRQEHPVSNVLPDRLRRAGM